MTQIEFELVQKLFDKIHKQADIKVLGHVDNNVKGITNKLPLHGFSMGSKDPAAPVFGLFAGAHGLEKIGIHLLVSFIDNIYERLLWDEQLQQLLQKVRIVSLPILNPTGVLNNTRSNVRGVDLIRNAPVEAMGETLFLTSGHRYSNHLPWYRGLEGEIEIENQILHKYLEDEVWQSRFCFCLDIHSGFGMKDRLWYPYSKTKNDFPHKNFALAFSSLFEQNHPYHVYKIEPQSDSYLIHGDPWDYAYDLFRANAAQNSQVYERVMIPWTLELGSWMWVKKNLRQIFNSQGLFNPLIPHRYRRIMRRHKALLDFFLSAVANHKTWAPLKYLEVAERVAKSSVI